MALADVYEVRLTGQVNGKTYNSVFHALRDNGSIDAQDIVSVFVNDVLPSFMACVPDTTTAAEVTAKSLGNALDFYTASGLGQSGSRSGDSLGPFVGPALRFTRKRTDMHHGYKRLPGIIETDQTDGVVQSALVTLLAALGTDLVTPWEEPGNPGVPVATYVIVKRILDGGEYRLPETDGELIYYAPTNVAVMANTTSQNSRKF